MNKQDIDMIFGSKIEIIEEKENYVYYNTHKKSSKGTIKQYQLWEGVYLYFTDFYVKDVDSSDVNIEYSRNLICINHCDLGMFEGMFKNGQCVQLSEGDISINLFGGYDRNSHCFPLSRYRGIILILDIDTANSSLINVLEEDYVLELASIKNKINEDNRFVLYKNQSELNEIFKGFYNNFDNKFYLKVKTLELLYFLCEKEIKGVTNTKYYEKQQLHKVNEIKDFLINNIATRYTISQLAEEFDISVTSLKECFKEVHGVPIGEYIRNYRISFARKSIAETDTSIADIAYSIGYENQSKFTQTFKKTTGMTPIEYRNKKANKWKFSLLGLTLVSFFEL